MDIHENNQIMEQFKKHGQELSRKTIYDYNQVKELKVRLITAIGKANSIRDFGGLYLVHGKYLLEPAVRLGCSFASMVDVTPLKEWEVEKKKAKEISPALKDIEFVHGDFREPGLYSTLVTCDISILYEVLLHQENYIQVIKEVINRTGQYVCFAQPCIREEWFNLPNGAVLLQFYEEPLKNLLRKNGFWPEESIVDRFTTRYWMWGRLHILFPYFMDLDGI